MTVGFSEALLRRVSDLETRIDQERGLPDELVQALHDEGAFRLLIPLDFGGMELPFPDYVRWIRKLAMHDASTAWCVNQAAVIGTTTLWLPADAIREIWSDPAQCVANGPPLDAVIDPVTCTVNGDWGFSSGCRHARLMSGAVRRTGDNAWRVVFFPHEAAEFIDDWQTSGLRGTASFRFRVRDLVIPEHRIANLAGPASVDMPLVRVATGLAFAVSFASLALGVARRGLDFTIALAGEKKPIYARDSLREDGTVHHRLGELEARWRSARAWLDDAVESVWDEMGHQSHMTEAQRIEWRLCGMHVIREAVAVMQGSYQICGSTGIYRASELHRPWSDMQVISQHVQGREQYYAFTGRWLTGHPYEFGPLT